MLTAHGFPSSSLSSIEQQWALRHPPNELLDCSIFQYLANGLSSRRARNYEVHSIRPEDVRRAVKQATRKVRTS